MHGVAGSRGQFVAAEVNNPPPAMRALSGQIQRNRPDERIVSGVDGGRIEAQLEVALGRIQEQRIIGQIPVAGILAEPLDQASATGRA